MYILYCEMNGSMIRSRFYPPPQVNLDLTISVLSFLLSDNALFLRESLINELLDTMDEVWGSIATGVDAAVAGVDAGVDAADAFVGDAVVDADVDAVVGLFCYWCHFIKMLRLV